MLDLAYVLQNTTNVGILVTDEYFNADLLSFLVKRKDAKMLQVQKVVSVPVSTSNFKPALQELKDAGTRTILVGVSVNINMNALLRDIYELNMKQGYTYILSKTNAYMDAMFENQTTIIREYLKGLLFFEVDNSVWNHRKYLKEALNQQEPKQYCGLVYDASTLIYNCNISSSHCCIRHSQCNNKWR